MKIVEVEVCKKFEFSAHHILPYYEPCSVHHGHNFTVTICVEGLIRQDQEHDFESGMVVSFDAIKKEWQKINDQFLDHRSLNSFLPNPTCERLCAWLAEYFEDVIAKNTSGRLSRLRVTETERSWAEWRRK